LEANRVGETIPQRNSQASGDEQAFELLRQAQKLREHAKADAEIRPPEEQYRLLLETDDETLSIPLKIEAMGDAFWAAEALAAACADHYTRFELWRGWRIIYCGDTRNCVFTLNPSQAIAHATQAAVLEQEEFLEASRDAVARSKRMLAMMEQLQQKLARTDLDISFMDELSEDAALQPKKRKRSR
jgi:hypothetical protein